ncbi:MAG: hypothetical protein ABI831_24160 [Betaproteobacteria bacterium]
MQNGQPANAFRRLLLIILATGGMAGVARAATPEEDASSAAREWAKAIMTHDVETEMKLLPPALFPKPADRERARLMKLRERELAVVNGDKYLSFEVRLPIQTVKIDKVTAVVLPYTSELGTPKGKLQTNSALIAIFEQDSGKWSIIDGSGQNPRSLKRLIPGYTANLQLPPALVNFTKIE